MAKRAPRWMRVDAGIYRRNSSYLIDFFTNGKRYYVRLGRVSLTVARQIVAELRGDIARRGAGLTPLSMTISIADLVGTRVEERNLNVAATTWRRLKEHEVHLKRHLGRFDAKTLVLKDIRDYQKKRIGEGAKPGTVNRETTLLHASIRMAVRERRIERDVIDGFEKLPEPEPGSCAKVLSQEEVEKIAQSAVPWFRRFIAIAVGIGCRAGELSTVRIGDVDNQRGLITFRSETVKGRRGKRRSRTIPLPSNALNAAREQLAAAVAAGSEFLFYAPRNIARSVQVDQLNQAWRRVRKKVGVRGRLHDLRHTFISRQIKDGAEASIVRRIVGHASTQMIDSRYAHLDTGDLATTLLGLDARKESHTIPTAAEKEGVQKGAKVLH